MKNIVKCTKQVDTGATRIRSFHNYRDCGRPAKYKVTYKNGRTEFVCGVHKRQIEYYMQWYHDVESIKKMIENESNS